MELQSLSQNDIVTRNLTLLTKKTHFIIIKQPEGLQEHQGPPFNDYFDFKRASEKVISKSKNGVHY